MNLPSLSRHENDWGRRRPGSSVHADRWGARRTRREERRCSSGLASHSLEQVPSPYCRPGPLARFSLGTCPGTRQAPVRLPRSQRRPLHPALGRLPACLCFLSLASAPPPPSPLPHFPPDPEAIRHPRVVGIEDGASTLCRTPSLAGYSGPTGAASPRLG